MTDHTCCTCTDKLPVFLRPAFTCPADYGKDMNCPKTRLRTDCPKFGERGKRASVANDCWTEAYYWEREPK
jgi:hypothetical protein